MKLAYVTLGSDPELFIEKNGEIVGSEKAIPKDGLKQGVYYQPGVVLDGVQLELHPQASQGAGPLTNQLSNIFRMLKTHLDKTPEMKACFKPVVKVTKAELTSLSDDSRVLGCQPSRNYYGLKMPPVDPVKYRTRSAGGHIHFGLSAPIYNSGSGKDYRTRLVPICDLLLGNLSVLLDLDEGQKERRKLYGMAGEYRLPVYGLEYRTLSNFWLRGVPLYQLVMGLAHHAVSILSTTLTEPTNDIEIELLDSVDFKRVVRAIQKSDYDLAFRNWESIKPFIIKHFDASSTQGAYNNPMLPAPIHKNNIEKFDKFLANIKKEGGLEAYFPIEGSKVMDNWLTKTAWDGKEWFTFLEGVK